MLRGGLGYAMLMIAALTVMAATQAQAGGRDRACSCEDYYSACQQAGKGDQYCWDAQQSCLRQCHR